MYELCNRVCDILFCHISVATRKHKPPSLPPKKVYFVYDVEKRRSRRRIIAEKSKQCLL